MKRSGSGTLAARFHGGDVVVEAVISHGCERLSPGELHPIVTRRGLRLVFPLASFRCAMHLCLPAIFALIGSLASAAPLQVGVATFNASLNRNSPGRLATDLATGSNNQARRVAEIIQRVAPDILLINEFDYDPANPTLALTRFHNNYLAVSQNGQPPQTYPYRYIAPSNTGIPSGFDLDNNGSVVTTPGAAGYGDDCFGFGNFPGQYSFAVYSKFPIQAQAIRTFQLFKWKDMPGAALPDLAGTSAPADWYTAAELGVFRLSSKNHVDLPIELRPGHIVHLLASHPTPPAPFDGPEDSDGRRNHDEIRFWADYVSGAAYLYDDAGTPRGLGARERFIILGDLNADPLDGDSFQSAIQQLRNHPLVNAAPNPASPGGTQQSQLQGGINNSHRGNPAHDTSDFSESSAGNLRVDHVLPSKLGFNVVGSGVFWPANTDPAFGALYLSATQTQGNQTTDHRLVYLDLVVLPIPEKAVRNLTPDRRGNDLVLTWQTEPETTYGVETSPDLATWSAASQISVIVDTSTQSATATDVGGVAGPQKFYRVVAALNAPPAGAPQRAPSRLRRRSIQE